MSLSSFAGPVLGEDVFEIERLTPSDMGECQIGFEPFLLEA